MTMAKTETVVPAPTPEEVKVAQMKHWDTVAEGWGKWHAWTDRNFGPLTGWLAAATGWRPGAHILDVACGAGFPAFAAAAAVRPNGRVVGADLSPHMVVVARRLAQAAGLDNLDVVEMDAESLTFPDESFDAATCVCGLMFCPNPGRAVAEMRRVVKRGGRLAIAVWDQPSTNAFVTVIAGAIGRFLSLAPPPPPPAPGPF
jgi:SAM-dependent methyltransferase